MAAWPQRPGGVASGKTRADGDPPGKPFGERHHVGQHVLVLKGKPAPGSTHAGLNLIQHQ